VARQHGIKKAKDGDLIGKLFVAYLRRIDESALGSVLVQLSLVLAASRQNGANVLREAATLYKVDVDAIALKVRQEFAGKERSKKTNGTVTAKSPQKTTQSSRKKAAA
jgi:ParB family chromosome partitioning protein